MKSTYLNFPESSVGKNVKKILHLCRHGFNYYKSTICKCYVCKIYASVLNCIRIIYSANKCLLLR